MSFTINKITFMVHIILKNTLSLFTTLVLVQSLAFAQTEKMVVDHRYSVPWWQTLICLPDDPVKTLVGREGQIFGDFNYNNGPRRFSSSILFDSKIPATWKSQELKINTIPMTETIKESEGIIINEQAFLEIPAAEKLYSIVRYDSRRALRDWSKPSVPCDDSFKDAAQGIKGLSGEGLIDLRIKVLPGSTHQVVLGFCEGQYEVPGERVMRIHVEGAEEKDVDIVKDFGPKKPGVYIFDSKDADNDGILTVVVSNMPGAKDRTTILNSLWLFKDKAPAAEAIISGSQNKKAALYAAAANIGMPERRYHILVTLTNTTAAAKTFSPVVRYAGIDTITKAGNNIQIDEYSKLSSSVKLLEPVMDSVRSYTIGMQPISLNAGEKKQLTVTISRFFGKNAVYIPAVPTTLAQQEKVIAWWTMNSPSAEAINVPDEGVQSMVASSIRNIFQARDIRKGSKSFHVGPTFYRGLWLADGAYLLEVATMLGYVKDTRSCIDYLTHFQLEDGGFEMIETFHKENGLVPFMITRHAQLTQDKKWLEQYWSVVEGCIKRINYLRGLGSKDPSKPYYGILPNGNVDGGIQHGNDYSNTQYCLAGMKWAINSAKWLGKNTQAAIWQNNYDTLHANFMNLARKDIRKDEKGNTYLPVMINNEGNYPAPRGQWAFLQSVYPGQVFDDNPEVKQWATETVDMLTDHRIQGLVYDSGWMKGGIWSYFSSFYSHALLWLGKPEGIPEQIYAFANHSSPTMVWREEQKPQGQGYDEVGDMPHNWASAEFIRMVVHSIQFDRGNDLHLLEAFPKQWAQAGNKTTLKGIRTPFGPINFSFVVNEKGDAGKLTLEFLETGHLPNNVVINKKTWTTGQPEVIKASKKIERTIAIN